MREGAKLLQGGNAKEALPLLYHAYQLRPDDVDAAIRNKAFIQKYINEYFI